MAFWDRRPGNRVYVYVWDRDLGRQRALKRELTKHLDGEPDNNVDAWVQQYKEQFENKKYDLEDFLTDQKLNEWLEAFCVWMRKNKRSEDTIHQHAVNLRTRVFNYFLSHELPNPNNWPSRSAKMIDYLRERGESDHTIYRCNVALRRFWEWLLIERHLVTPYDLLLQNPAGYFEEDDETPLKVHVNPDEALAFIKATKDRDMKLLALLGYFFSLRPQESMALMRKDFKAGSAAAAEESCKAMAKAGLYDRLCVNVYQQRNKQGKLTPPKSKGIVSCFDERAARMLVDLIRDMKKADDPLMKLSVRWLSGKWKRHGLKKPDINGVTRHVTLKDLRRSSIYWLGHYTDITPAALTNHARHTDPKTTRKYLRRAYHEETAFDKALDLGA